MVASVAPAIGEIEAEDHLNPRVWDQSLGQTGQYCKIPSIRERERENIPISLPREK